MEKNISHSYLENIFKIDSIKDRYVNIRKVAVFGKPGSGKSTLSKKLALTTGIQLYPLDSIVYKEDGRMVDKRTYGRMHENILSSECWIIDGIGPI